MAADVGGTLRRVHAWQWGILVGILGGVLLVVGLVQTTTATPPEECPAGTELIAKFEYQGGSYVFEKPAGNAGVVRITDSDATSGDWSSSVGVTVVIVKGGDGSSFTTYAEPQTSGTFSNGALPPVGSGNLPDISNVQFCGPAAPPVTTTAPPGTTTPTTEPPPTTTAPPGTTTPTTEPPPTTTAPPGTTTPTTEPPPTTAPPGTTTPTTAPPGTTTPTTGVPSSTSPTTQVGGVVSTRVETFGGDEQPLAQTGDPSIPLVILGASLLLVGVGLIVVDRFRQRNVRA